MNEKRPRPEAQLVLGTAQWGLSYGIANRRGRPATEEVEAILRLARGAGVHILDTARAYGRSERVIGETTAGDPHWRIVTKLAPDLTGDPSAIVAAAENSLRQSRRALALDQLDTVLLHRPDQLSRGRGAAWQHLLRQRQEGMIRKLGVSVLVPEQAMELLDHPEIDVLQVPFNLLDTRLRSAGFFKKAREVGKEVFVRSVFLQGLVFLSSRELNSSFAPVVPVLSSLDTWARDHGLTRTELFLGYAQGHGVHVVLGCETCEQMAQNLAIWARRPMAHLHAEEVETLVPELPDAILDPAQW